MVKDGTELIVQCLQVYGGVFFTIFIPIAEHIILPDNDIPCRNFIELALAEVRQNFCPDDMLFCTPRAFPQTNLHIRRVGLHESRKGHIQISRGLLFLGFFPGECFTFCTETAIRDLFREVKGPRGNKSAFICVIRTRVLLYDPQSA
jgi:hypothetical protein